MLFESGSSERVSLSMLTDKAKLLFSLSLSDDVKLSYIDDDGDVIAVDSEEEVDEAFRILEKVVFTIGPVKKPAPAGTKPLSTKRYGLLYLSISYSSYFSQFCVMHW